LVPMHEEAAARSGKAPFFLVAGMFGNVLNLRHLAQLVGSDRPFYGLQARGLYGDARPHETFEEMARDYLAELRQVQPRGPYFLGGFSGGGITAYEMARQLAAEGEEVPLIVLLDTPLPSDRPLDLRERLLIQRQRLARRGPRYLIDWWQGRRAHAATLAARAAAAAGAGEGTTGPDPARVIEAAFYRACERYTVEPTAFRLALFRPKLRVEHQLGPGRAINEHRRRIYHDNGWAPFVAGIQVFEVPGDHDGMVLEPNVRVLALKLRGCLEVAETAARAGAASRGAAVSRSGAEAPSATVEAEVSP
ncbi:MAG: thioesterase domain-containing protein, partial [Armatimonadota bacterium]|nr:thioesterase domain-containing protein [Armatimonadota bacterium]